MYGTDIVVAIDLHLKVQPIVLEQNTGGIRLPKKAHELFRFLQTRTVAIVNDCSKFPFSVSAFTDTITNHISVACPCKRKNLVKNRSYLFYDEFSSGSVVGVTFFSTRTFWNYVGSVKGIIKTSPSRVGSVQCISSIHNRYHQLRAGESGNFLIHISSGDFKIIRFW